MFTSRSRTFQQPIAKSFTSSQEAKELKYFLSSCELENNYAQDEEEKFLTKDYKLRFIDFWS